MLNLNIPQRGKNLEFDWQNTSLGIRVEGEVEFTYVNLQGPPGEASWENLSGKPVFFDYPNQPGGVVIADEITGKIRPELIPDSPFGVGRGIYELATFKNFQQINLQINDPSNSVVWWFLKTGEIESSQSAITKKQGDAVAFLSSENPTGQPVRVLFELIGTGNLDTITYFKSDLDPDNIGETSPYLNLTNLTNLQGIELINPQLNIYSNFALCSQIVFKNSQEISIDLTEFNNLVNFQSHSGRRKQFIFGEHLYLDTLVLRQASSVIFNSSNLPLIRFLDIVNGSLTSQNLEQIISLIYQIEQIRQPILNCRFDSRLGQNSAPNAATLQMMDWLRTNRGWTINHN